jgi:hypothetical protein
MLRKLIVCGLLGSFLLATVGCGDRNPGVVMPKGEIPLPKDGPVAAGAGGKKAQPVNAPKGASAAQ